MPKISKILSYVKKIYTFWQFYIKNIFYIYKFEIQRRKMLNILLTMLTYIDLRATWQADAMQDSQMLQDLQYQSSNEQTKIMQAQTNEEALVQMELEGAEDVSTEQYTKVLQEMSQISTKYETQLQNVMSKVQAQERQINQRITAREPKIKAVDADIESLQETLDKRTEESFTYMQN